MADDTPSAAPEASPAPVEDSAAAAPAESETDPAEPEASPEDEASPEGEVSPEDEASPEDSAEDSAASPEPPAADGVETLGDLVFRLRSEAGGQSRLLTVSRDDESREDVRRAQGVESFSTTDFLRAVHSLAVALDGRGVRRGERVAILSENRPEWHVVDFACQLLGVATVPIFPGLTADEVGYILRNSGSRWIFYSDRKKHDLLHELQGSLTQDLTPIAFDSDAAFDDTPSLTRLQGEGAERVADVPLERFRGRADANDLASLIYTSGTTGEPKGVMLSHRNLLSNVRGCAEVFHLDADDLAISFLPLSHVFQRTVDLLCFYRGVPIHYVPNFDDVPSEVRRRRPTVMAAAPGVYERAHARTLREVEHAGGARRLLFRWALSVGKRHATAAREGIVGPLLGLQRWLANRLVYRRLRERFGGRLRFAISGGAPLADEVGEFFDAIGIPLYQGYGLTETSPVLATNHPEGRRPGSVGRALSDVELRIAEDGEILVRGPGVMKGYWQNPRATELSIDESGWFRTGDVGRVDRSGYLFVTDRKRDLLVTSEGHNVAPRPVEALLGAEDVIERALVVGDGRPFVGALLVPDLERLAALVDQDLEELDDDARRQLLARPEIHEAVDDAVERVNQRLALTSRIGGWTFLPRPLSQDEGELTPTRKVRRKVVSRRYAAEIEGLYRKGGE